MKNCSRTFDEEFALKRERYSRQIAVGGCEAGASAALRDVETWLFFGEILPVDLRIAHCKVALDALADALSSPSGSDVSEVSHG